MIIFYIYKLVITMFHKISKQWKNTVKNGMQIDMISKKFIYLIILLFKISKYSTWDGKLK